MNHWNLFKESWRIFWRHPALWLFGLLAALGGGFNLRYNFNLNFSPAPNDFFRRFGLGGQQIPEIPLEFRALLNQIFSSQTFNTIVAIGIVWIILAFLLATYADGALMGMVNAIGNGQKVSVGFGFRAGAKRFLHLLAVRFTLALPALLLAIVGVIVTSQIFLGPGGDLGTGQFPNRAFAALSGLGALSFIVVLLMMGIGVSAERAVVIDEMPIWPSIVKGWRFLWRKFGDYFILVLLFIGIAILAGIIFACILAPILCGTVGLGALGALGDNRPPLFTRVVVFAGPTVVVAVIFGLMFGTLANVFASSVWTLAYREWNQPAQPATAIQPSVAPPIAPIPPSEPPTSAGSTSVEPQPKDQA